MSTSSKPRSSDPFDYVGEVGYNEDKFKLRVLYQWNDFTLSLDNTYFGSALDDVGQEPDDYSLNSIGSMNYLDVQARYRFNDRFEIYGGIDNITDEDPPYCPSCKNEPVLAATTLACSTESGTACTGTLVSSSRCNKHHLESRALCPAFFCLLVANGVASACHDPHTL